MICYCRVLLLHNCHSAVVSIVVEEERTIIRIM